MNKRVMVICALASVVLVAIWYVAVFSSQSKSIHKANLQTAAANTDAAALRGQISLLQQEKAHLSDSTTKLATLKLALPDTPALDKMIDDVNAAAIQTGVDWKTLTPTKPATYAAGSAQAVTAGFPGGMQSVNVAFSVSGSYKQVTDFISKLSAISRLLAVTSVNLTGVGGNAPSSAQIVTQMFFVPPAVGAATVTH